MRALEDLRDMLCAEVEHIAKKGEVTNSNLDAIDKLTHSIKSIDTIMAMEDSGYSNDGGYSNARGQRRDSRGRYSRMDGGSYGRPYMMDGGSYNDGSYGYSRRYYDGMSYRGGYSGAEGKEQMISQLEDMMRNAPTEKAKEAIHKAITQMEAE